MPENASTVEIDLIARGGSVKALGDGKIGGYLVLFSDADTPDLEDDFFNQETNFGPHDMSPVYYHHGQDATLKHRVLDDKAEIGTDEVGVWIRAQLALRDEYEKAIYQMIEAEKMGWSSGTASHLVERVPQGKSQWIKSWPLGIDASLTPTPAEPRSQVTTVKSIEQTDFKLLCESEPGEAPKKSGPDEPQKRGSKKNSERKATKMDELLEAIRQLVPGLSEEQYGQLGAILQLYSGTMSNSMAAEPEYEEEMMGGEPMRSRPRKYRNPTNAPQPPTPPAEQPNLTEALAAALKQLGISLPQPDPKKNNGAPPRPPYNFEQPTPDPDEDDGLKSISILRFGETPDAIKSVVKELYGSDYEAKRLSQHRAFAKYVRYGQEALNQDERRYLKMVILTPDQIKAAVINGVMVDEMKTEMSEVIDTLGGMLVPEDVRLDMIERLPGRTTVRRYADVGQTSSDLMTRVKVTGGDDRYTSAVRVTWVGDTPAQDQADTAPTFGLEKTPIHIAKITVPVPMALLEDTPYPLTQKLSEWAAASYGIDEDAQFLTGNGIAKPEGILPGGANSHSLNPVINGSTTILDANKVIETQYGIAQQYWQNAVWTMRRATASACRQLKAGDGHYLWRDGLEGGQPPTLLGFPVEMNEAMPAIASNAYPMMFGDYYEGYQIADRIGMSLLRDEVTEAEQDIVKFLFRRRLGGQLKGEWAFSVLKMATS